MSKVKVLLPVNHLAPICIWRKFYPSNCSWTWNKHVSENASL